MNSEKTSCIDSVTSSWRDATPDWIIELAREVDRTSLRRAGRRIGYSATTICLVLANKYPADITSIKEKVRGVLMGVTVMCPIVGEIFCDRCLTEQRNDTLGTSEVRTRLYHYCRSGKCPHSHLISNQRSAMADEIVDVRPIEVTR